MPKLRLTVTVEYDIPADGTPDLLEQYEATTTQEAATNELAWIADGSADIYSLLDCGNVEYNVVPLPD